MIIIYKNICLKTYNIGVFNECTFEANPKPELKPHVSSQEIIKTSQCHMTCVKL